MCCMDTCVANDENHRDFLNRQFHYWFCSPKQATEVSKQVSSRTPTWACHVDALEQYGRRDKILISGVDDEHNEEVYQKSCRRDRTYLGYQDKTDDSVCHRFPTRRNGPNGIMLKFVRTKSKHVIMGNKEKLREMGQRVFNSDAVTPLRLKILYFIGQKEKVAILTTVNEKLIMYLNYLVNLFSKFV